jgi:hypothetical protein
MDTLALPSLLLRSLILSVIVGAIVMASLMYNARLWLQDYPKPIRDRVPPLSPSEKRGRIVVGVLFIGVLLGGLLLETAQLRAHAGLSFGAAYLHFFVMLFVFNLFDALVLDLFILTLLKPKFAILPGAEDLTYLFYDYRKQVGDFLKGMVFCVVASLPFAAIAVL